MLTGVDPENKDRWEKSTFNSFSYPEDGNTTFFRKMAYKTNTLHKT
jgi:hypothetical protein